MLILRYLPEEMKNRSISNCFLRSSISILKTGNNKTISELYGVAFWLYFLKHKSAIHNISQWIMLVLRYLLEEMKNKNALDCFLRPSIKYIENWEQQKIWGRILALFS
jgi:hypothetical protein